MKKALIPIFLISLPLSAVTFATEEESNNREAETATMRAVLTEDGHNLVETLKTSGYTVFAELLELTGVMGELKEGEPFTCFAPRNEAFNMEVFNKLKEDPKNAELLDLMRYHLIQKDQTKDIILISRRERTLGGKFLVYWITKGQISINNHSDLIAPDIKTKGGVIHGVSKILDPDAEGAIP